MPGWDVREKYRLRVAYRLGDKFGERIADSHSLKIGQADDAMLAKVAAARTGPADHSGKRGRLLLDKRGIALRGGVQIGAQIVMMLEESPRRTTHAANFEREARDVLEETSK